MPERFQVHEVDEPVYDHHESGPRHETERHVPHGVLHLLGDVVRVLPPAVGEHHRNQGRTEGEEQHGRAARELLRPGSRAQGSGRSDRRGLPRPRLRAGQEKTGADQEREWNELEHDQGVEEAAPRLHADVVDRRDGHDGQYGEDSRVDFGPSDQSQRVLPECDPDRRDRRPPTPPCCPSA